MLLGVGWAPSFSPPIVQLACEKYGAMEGGRDGIITSRDLAASAAICCRLPGIQTGSSMALRQRQFFLVRQRAVTIGPGGQASLQTRVSCSLPLVR
jgi:hypothetical protein